ncbi:hypothetical protein Vau01_122520 [Virgisporangium aurantiacum]|uniref:Uncharacterized protein n=1 Tax=Virgisporangium aurantiacum TaxID=175570 RepID=A0A8J4E7N2_9ACTN|nr:hypothetical protein Vau01_122520 [Virgisporangium aurantiacum]
MVTTGSALTRPIRLSEGRPPTAALAPLTDRQNRHMSTAHHDIEHLIVAQHVFAGNRFWAALDPEAGLTGRY